jgi:macrolide-specific efflux system membrane fusion protein
MKNISLFVLVTLALGLSACSQNATQAAVPTVVLNSNSVSTGGSITASGEIVPKPKAQLSFPLTGIVKSVDVEVGDKVTAGQTLATLDTTFWEAKVNEAEAQVVADQANERFLMRLGEDQEHIDAANADVEASQAAVESAKATLKQATLTAPFDGTIASVDISPAETVVPGQEVIQIGDFSHFQVETTDLSERDAPDVQIGQTANVSVTALNQTFPGKVVDIARVASTVGGDVVYKVTIELDSQPAGLLWGMTTNVEILTGK